MLGSPTLIEFNSVEENIEFALKYGFDFIELNLNLPYVQEYLKSNKVPDQRLKYTLHFFDEADFGLYDLVSDAYITLLDQYLKNSYTYINQVNIHLNVGPIVTVSGVKNYIYNIYYNDYINRLKNNLSKLNKICNKYNVRLVIENILSLDFICNTFKLLDKDYYFTYDYGHDMTSGSNLYDYFINNLDKFKEVHFHDSTSSKCHLTLGSGNADIDKTYNLIKDKIEYILLEVKSSKDLIDSMNYIRNIKKEVL